MADNMDVTPGTGKTIAADEIAGVLHQRVKMQHGDDGEALDASATNPLPTTDAGITAANGKLDSLVTDFAAVKNLLETPDPDLPPPELQAVSRYQRKIVDLATATETEMISEVAGQTIRVHGFRLVTPVAANELGVWNGPVSDNVPQDLLNFSGAGAGFLASSDVDPLWETSVNKALVFKATGAARITGVLYYLQD